MSNYGAVRCVTEEELEGDGKDWVICITEVEAELGKSKDSISYQITVLVRVRGHSGHTRHRGGVLRWVG